VDLGRDGVGQDLGGCNPRLLISEPPTIFSSPFIIASKPCAATL